MNTRMEILKRYLEEDPSDSFLRYALALEFMSLNDKEEAYKQLEKLLNDKPDYLPAYYIAGNLSEAAGNNSQAISWYLKGIEVARQQKDQKTLDELTAALEIMDGEE